MSVLQQILETKRAEVEQRKRSHPANRFPERSDAVRDFAGALAGDGIGIIAEIKRKSPSRGDLMPDADPVEVAQSYEANGAAALSVLTDRTYFGGSLEFLQEIRSRVALPVLRKDFIIDRYQVRESFAAGADAILLILEAMEFAEVQACYNLARELGLHVLVESYADRSLELLQELHPTIAGVNARDLSSMAVDFEGMLRKRAAIPAKSIAVAESGILEPAQLRQAGEAGFQAALIGTAFMQTGDPGKALRRFADAASIPGERRSP